MILRNLTAHAVRLIVNGILIFEVASEGVMARVVDTVGEGQALEVTGASAPIPLRMLAPGASVQGLPAPEVGVGLVVSRITAFACPARRDLYFPFDEVRDEGGRIIGCSALGRVAAVVG